MIRRTPPARAGRHNSIAPPPSVFRRESPAEFISLLAQKLLCGHRANVSYRMIDLPSRLKMSSP